MLMSAAWGAVACPRYAVSVAHANDDANPDEYIMISSGLLLMFGLGAVAGPFLAPILMNYMGVCGLYLFSATIHSILLIYIFFRISRRSPVPDEEQLPLSDSLASTQTASHIYEEEM